MKSQSSPHPIKRVSLLAQIYQHRVAYMFIGPAVFVMLLIHIIPSLQALYMSSLTSIPAI
jgi:ABC-type sugar transport system permease subunit